MKTVSINLYSFSELNDHAKNRAIDEHRDFMQSFPDQCENEFGELVFEYADYTMAEVIQNIEANEYLFFADGTLADTVQYVGKHPKVGISELTFYGEIYTF